MRAELRTVPRVQRKALGIEDPPTLRTWQEPVINRWAFRHLDEIVPTATISHVPLSERRVSVGLGAAAAVPELRARLEATFTDAFVVERGGEVVAEHYAPGFGPEDRHLLMSVSKSLCGIVIGTLIDEGLLDTGARTDRYLPELGESAFGDATVRQLLDMTAAVDYSEEYTDPDSEVQTHDRAAGWRPRRAGDPADVYEFLTTLGRSRPHGERFQYCSAVTDVLAWLAERVTDERYADVLSERLWSRLGCEREARIGVDLGGFSFANGGVACTARDLVRVGRLMLDGGTALGERVVSEAWVAETLAGADPALSAEARKREVFPNFSYRNQWWSVGDERGSVHAVGIHGQYIWLDPATDTVIVKFSSEPLPVSADSSRANARIFADVIAAVAR